MADKRTIIVGFLTLIILASIVYIQLNDNVKMRVDEDKTTFYTKLLDENGEPYGGWLVSGREISSIWDGSTKLNRKSSEIEVNTTINDNFVTITRVTPYIRGPVIKDTYEFDGSLEDVTQFPVSHTIEVINGSGYIYQYEVQDLTYTGETIKDITSPQSFEKNMKIEWQDSNYYSKIYKYKNEDKGKLTIKYRPTSDYEVYSIRLFDPPTTQNTNIILNSPCDGCTIGNTAYLNVTINSSEISTFNISFYNITADFSLIEHPSVPNVKHYGLAYYNNSLYWTNDNENITKTSIDGTFIEEIDLSLPIVNSWGVTLNDEYMLVTNFSGNVYRFYHNGTYIDTILQSPQRRYGIDFDVENSSQFWLMGTYEDTVFKYDLNGNQILNFSIFPYSNFSSTVVYGITNTDQYIIVSSINEEEFYRFKKNGTYDKTYSAALAHNSPRGIDFNENYSKAYITEFIIDDLNIYKYLSKTLLNTQNNIAANEQVSFEFTNLNMHENYTWMVEVDDVLKSEEWEFSVVDTSCNEEYYTGNIWFLSDDFTDLETALANDSVQDRDIILANGDIDDANIVVEKQVCIDGKNYAQQMDTLVINTSNVAVYNVNITDTKLRFGRDDDEITIEILDGFENISFDNIGFSALTGPGDGDDLRAIYDNGEKNNRFTNLEFSTITGGNGASHTGADGDDGGDVMLYYGYSDNTLLENISFEYMKTGNGGNGYESNDDDCRDGGHAGHNSKVIYSQGDYITVRNLQHTATDGLLGGNGGSGECDSGANSCARGGYQGQFADIIHVEAYANLYDIKINGYTEGAAGAQACNNRAISGVSVLSSVDTIQGEFVIVDNVTMSNFTLASGSDAFFDHASEGDYGAPGGSGNKIEINLNTYSDSKISNILITDWQLGGGGDAVTDCDDAGDHCGYMGGSSSELTAYIGSDGLGSAENITIRDITQGIGGSAQTSYVATTTYCKESGDNNGFYFYLEFNDYTNFSIHDLTIPDGISPIDEGDHDDRGGAGGDTENILIYFDNPITPIEEDNIHIYNISIGTGGTGTCTPAIYCRDGASGDYVFDVHSYTNISNIIIQDIKTGGDASGGCACTSTAEQSHCGGIRILDFSGDQPALDDSSYADQVMYSGALRNLTVSNLNASDWVWGFGAYEEIDGDSNYGSRWWAWNPSPDKIIKSYHPYTTEEITWFTSSMVTGNYSLYYSLEPEGDMTFITTNTVDYFCPGQGTTNPNCNYTWDTSGLDKEYYYIMINNTDWETTVPGNATNVFSPSYYYLVGAVDLLTSEIEVDPSGRIYQDTTLMGVCNATTDTYIITLLPQGYAPQVTSYLNVTNPTYAYDNNEATYATLQKYVAVSPFIRPFLALNYTIPSGYSASDFELNYVINNTSYRSDMGVGVRPNCINSSYPLQIRFRRTSSAVYVDCFDYVNSLWGVGNINGLDVNLNGVNEVYVSFPTRLSNITYNYTWYNDTGIVSSGTTSGNYLSGYRANINNLSNSLTTIHSNYTLQCVGIDEEGNESLPINSTSVYINENPIITSTARLVPTVTKEYDEIDEIQVWCNASSYAGTDIGHRVDWYRDIIITNVSWDIENITNTDNITTNSEWAAGMFFSTDGTQLYESTTLGVIYQHACSEAWNLSTCIYTGQYLITDGNWLMGLFFKSDGTKLYTVDGWNNLFFQYDCSDAWNITTCVRNINISTVSALATDMSFTSDGKQLYEITNIEDKVYQFNCAEAWNLSTCAYTNEFLDLCAEGFNNFGLYVANLGAKVFTVGFSGPGTIFQYDCTDSTNISSCSYTKQTALSLTYPSSLYFKNDGLIFYVLNDNPTESFFQFSLSSYLGDSVVNKTETSDVIYDSGVEVNPFNLTIGHDEIGTWYAECSAFDARFPYTYDTAVTSGSTKIVSEMIYARPGQITPNPAYINNILNGYCNATHADGYSIGYNYTWIVDGVSVETGSDNNGSSLFASNKLVFIDSLPLEYTDEGDVVNFECMAWDANGYTGNKTNTTVTIANSPPNLVSVRIRPTNATVNSTLVGEILFNDLDEGYSTINYNWYNNSVLYKSGEVQAFPGITNDISTIPQSEVNLGDAWIFEVKINDSVNIINWTNSTESHVLSHTIEINHTADNWDMELSKRDLVLNISGTILGETACLDITSDRYTETNIACSTENVSTLFTVPHTYFLRNTFINGTYKENLTFAAGETRVAQFVAHEYDEVENLTFNLTGYDVGGVYPTDIVIRVNGNEIASIGEIYDADEVIKDTFYSGNDYKEHLFSKPEVAIVDYISIPKTATVNDLTFNITGLEKEYMMITNGNLDSTHENSIAPTYDFGQSFISTSNATLNSIGYRVEKQTSGSSIGTLDVGTSYGGTELISGQAVTMYYSTGSCFITPGVSALNWSYITGISGQLDKGTTYYFSFDDYTSTLSRCMNDNGYIGGISYYGGQPDSYWGTEDDMHFRINATSYPWDLWIDVGDIESSHAWSHADILNDEQEVSGFVSQINSYLTDCTADDYGMCQVPIYIYSDNGGMINLTDLVINYTYNPNPITADIGEFSSFLRTQDKYNFVDLDVTSATTGVIEISDLQYKYAGGKDTYEVTLHNPTYTTSVGMDLNQYYSKWDYELPANIDYIDFYPWAADAKNVTPFAQSNSIPIMNVSNYAYGGKNFTFWSTINNSEACVDLYINNNNMKNTHIVEERVWNITKTNSVYDTTFGIWMWADLSCSYQQWYNWYPDYYFRACCDDCDWCDTTLE